MYLILLQARQKYRLRKLFFCTVVFCHVADMCKLLRVNDKIKCLRDYIYLPESAQSNLLLDNMEERFVVIFILFC